MPDKIKEAFEATKDNGIFLDEEDFRSSLAKEPKAVFELFKADKKYADLFLDYDDFENSLDLKKKEQTQPFGGQIFTQGIGLGVKPISSTTSPSVSKQPKSIIPSEFTVEKPVSTAVGNIDLAAKAEDVSQRAEYLGKVSEGVLDIINKNPDIYISQKDIPTMYGEKVIPAGTPKVENISKAVDLYAEKIKKETGKDLLDADKQFLVQSVLSSLKNKKLNVEASSMTDLQLQGKKKLPLTAITGIKDEKGAVVKEGMFEENIKNIVSEEQMRLEKLSKTPSKEVSAEFSPEIEQLKSEVKNNSAALNAEMQSAFASKFDEVQKNVFLKYDGLVKSGQISADEANAQMKKELENIGAQLESDTNILYAPKFEQLKKDVDAKSQEIQTRYNRRVKAQFDLEKVKANKRIQDEVSRYKDALPKEYLEEYQALYQKNFESAMKMDGIKRINEFANLGNFEKMQTALMAGWGDVAGTVGGALSYVGLNTGGLQDWVAQSGIYNELPVFSEENILDNITSTDWWIANGVRSIPFTIATMPVGVVGGASAGMLAKALGASKRAQMISSVVGGGLVGWDAERFLEAGGAFNDAINEGKTLQEASEIAAAVSKYNYATIPLNIAQMLPVFSKSFKFLNSALIEAGSGYFEEVTQGWAQAKAKAQAEGQDVSYLDYLTSPQAVQEGIIGAGMSQGFTLLSLNNTPNIDKQINALMTSIGTGGENQAALMLEVMKNNGSIDSKQYEEAKALLQYTMNAIEQTQNVNVEDSVKSALINKFVAIEKAKELLTDNENDLASQAAKELIEEKEKEIKNILKGTEPVYLVKIKGNDIPVVSTKEQVDAILSNPASLPLFEIEVYNDIKTQASLDEAYSKQEKDAIKTKDEVSSGGTSARTDNTGTEVGDIASVTDKGESGKEVVNQEEIERLRAQEQAEVEATDPNDQEKLDEIYNRYDKLITSLLKGEKEVKYNIDEARQQFIKDNEIEAFQEKFGYEPYNPFESLPDGVYETILRVEDNIPTSLTAIEEASNWLYSQYKMLEAKKVSDKRDMTIPQIDEVLSELEGAITELENFKNKLYEESGQAKTGQDTTSVQAVDGQTSQGVRVGEEIATPTQEVAKEEISEQAKINKQNERADDRKPAAGNRLFNEPIKEIGAIADKYFKRVFGKERPKFKGTRKFDKAFSRKIAEAYAKMENNPNSPDVKAAYNALAKETLAQYKALLAAGYEIEISEENFYKNSQEMIDDVVKNKRIKIFSTEAGFGNKPISKKSRKENPMLMESGMKDKNGVPLLNNDLFRAVHDIIGHGELGNSFGAIGEENAFQIHARLYSPLARKALATETRGQNSFVNFSGINDKVSLMVEEARKLRAEGKEAEAQNLVEKIYEDLSFAEQKMGILPEEFYSIDESFEGEMEEPALSESAQGKENETQQIADELLSLLGLPTEETDVKFSKKTGEPQVLTSTEDKEQQIIDQMNKMNLVNEGIDLVAPSTTEEEIDVDELNSRLENPLKTVEWADYEGIPFTFTISDQLRTGDAANPNTGQTITDLKGGIGFNGTKGNENNAWANTTKEEADAMLQRAKDVYANNKPLFDKLWKEGKLPDGHIPMAVVKMAETSILSNEAVFRVGIQNIETLPKANRKKAVLELAKSMQAKINTESASLKRGVDKNGKPYTENTIKLKKKTINQYQKILDYINKNKYEDIVDILKDKDNFSLPEKSLIANEVFYGSPTPIGGKEIDISRSRPSTPVSKALIGNKNPSLINLSKITDLLTEPSMKNVPNMHVVSIVGVDVKANEANKINHPNYPYGVKGVSLGVLKNPVHMKDVFGEAYGSALGQVVKNEANNASVSVKNVLTQGIPVQSGLTNRVFKSAIAKGELDAVDKLAGFLRQAFPSTTFFTSEEAWEAAMKDPSVKKKLKDGDVVYAFTTDGNVFINPSLKTTKATLHETGHIWVGFVKENNPALHAKGLELVTGTKEHQKAIKEYGDTELAREEALMELMSSKGDTIVNAAQKAKFKEWLLSVYKYIADNFTSLLGLSPKQIENLTLDKFLEGMLADVLSGKELTTKKIKGEVRFSREAQDNKIGEFVESQRKAGKSDSNIRTALELVADKLGLTPSDIDSLMSAEKKPAKKREFTKNILDIAKETGLSPQEVEDTYKKYDGSKDIQEVTVEDYNSARAAGDKVKLDNSKKAFEAFLSEDSNSPTAKKNAAKLKEELGKDTLKGAKKIMDNIDEIREKLLNAKVIKPVNCKWGK